ncbi:uncharacterized protein LOC104424690 isoform X2 [Eucalyptus grandis]|uniref:uncharacterized protein LOC104424690 isoform X2 n=1 Tax=Eucalyptus grandis TaxID=71139 RepID=UPI00192EE741|nr:uncharacterized protein LOC104424690 isoform X2 [Eucalyptus grandis]
MLRKPLHGWRIKQGIQKLTVIRAPAPRLYPVREWAGSASRPTPTPRTSLSPLPPLFFSFAIRPPSTVAYYSRAPEPNADSVEDQLDEPNPNAQSQVDEDANMPEDPPQQEYFHGILIPIEVANMRDEDSPRREQEYFGGYPIEYFPLIMHWRKRSSEKIRERRRAASLEMKYGEEALDHFYQEMSKEVETILHEGDPRLPEKLSKRVVVTCLPQDCRDHHCTYVYVLRRRRKQGSGASATKSAAKESCRELEVELAMTYWPKAKEADAHWPSDHFPFEVDRIPHKWKVVNKFEFSSQDEDVFRVAKEEARKYPGWLIAQNKLAGKDMGKDTSNATLGKV